MDRVYPLKVTVTAGTQPSAPTSFVYPLEDNTLIEIEVIVPDGHAGFTGIHVKWGDVIVMPWGQGSWLIANDDKVTFPFNGNVLINALTVEAYNTDVFDHSFYLRAFIRDTVIAQQQEQVTTPAVDTSIETAGPPDALSVDAILGTTDLTGTGDTGSPDQIDSGNGGTEPVPSPGTGNGGIDLTQPVIVTQPSPTPTPIPLPQPIGRSMYGASVGTNHIGDGTIKQWETIVGVPMHVWHRFLGQNVVPTSYATSILNKLGNTHKLLLDIEPRHDGSQKQALDRFLGDCAQHGVYGDITVYHAAPSKGFANATAYVRALETYVPIVTKHGFRHVFDLTSYQVDVHKDMAVWWPGNHVYVEAFGLEYYGSDFKAGRRLEMAAAFADTHNVAFGLCEMGAIFKMPGNTRPEHELCTEQEGIQFFTYCYDFFNHRIGLRLPQYDIVNWNNVNQDVGYRIVNQPLSWVTMYRKIHDMLEAA